MKRNCFVLVWLFAICTSILTATSEAQEKRIYIANDDHTDYMWTADADTYANSFVQMLDFHLSLADQTAGNAPAYRNRFNADGSFWLWNYQQKKSPKEFSRLIDRIKDGTISAPLNSVVACYGGQPAEAVLRGMYYAGRLERQFDLRFPLAIAMENQTLPLGLASLFAGSGAKYSWRGVCGCATRMDKQPMGKRPSEIYWWTGHDDQRLLLKWHSLASAGNQHSGGYSEAFDPVSAIRFLDSDPGFLSRYRAAGASQPYKVRAAFGFGWDALDRRTGQPYKPNPTTYPMSNHFHDIAKAQSTPERLVIVSNEVDFFKDFEKEHASALESQTVTYGNEWDLYSASMSETSARVKRAVEKLRTAELLAVLVSLKSPEFMSSHALARDRAFNNLGLYWEHNWTADGPIPRPQRAAWQEQVAQNIESYVDAIMEDGTEQLGGLIAKSAKADRFFVLNSLGWSRTGHADFGYVGSADIHVRDLETGLDVPHQFVKLKGVTYLRILASNVPSAGYKVFEIASGTGASPVDEAATFTSDSTLENDSVKLVIERDGAIRSFIDKRHNDTEFAANIGQLKLNDFASRSDEGDVLQVENRGPVSVTVRARSPAGLDHTTAITLYRNSDRVDISNELLANFSDVRYWTFSFAVQNPVVYTEEVGAINLNKLKSAGGDYASSHARYDHITVNHFADISSGPMGMTLSNPDLAFARLGNSSVTQLDTTTPQLSMLSGGQVDGEKLGIHRQNGNSYFLQRFGLRAHGGYDPTAAMKFAMEHQNPLVTGRITADGGAYPEMTYSLLSVSDPNVLLWALKPHDGGIEQGVVARLWNVSATGVRAELSLTPALVSAFRTTHIETDLESIRLTGSNSVASSFQLQQMQTFRLLLSR
jgi:alpha-mannosidase